jgi:hypothetical protein
LETGTVSLSDSNTRRNILKDEARRLRIELTSDAKRADAFDGVHMKGEYLADGAGAFRRFKDILARYPSWEKQWFAFQRAKEEFRVKEWLEGKGYEVVIESRN